MTAAPGAAVAIYCKPHHRHAQEVAAALARWLQDRGYRTVSPADETTAVALAVVLGGDGTMLHVAARLAAAQTPVLAVHLGTLGFLTETALDDLYGSLETVLAGGGARQQRALLHCGLERNGRMVAEFEALNEAVVSKGALARLIQLELTVAGERVGIYRADGLLVATPTGSTAYSFSAGGPVLHPSLEALIVTPICPHSLSQRPLVVRDQAEVVITLQSGVEPTFLTVDGQLGQPLEAGDRIRCLRSLHALTLVTAGERSFYQNLRTKLHWG